MGSCNDSTQPFAKTICSICYEDLKPIVEDLQAISLCGHVFHELCIQQWFEYCSKGKKKCPICKQNCSASDVSRLYFQSVGDSDDPNLSQKPQTRIEDPEELKLEVKRLEGKIRGLNLALESRENDFIKITNELSVCKEQLKTETSLKNEAMEQKQMFVSLFKLKSQELEKSNLERNKLQERNLAIAKELAALKLVSDLNLEEVEIDKLTSLFGENNVGFLNKLLADRNRFYTELMQKYKTLARANEKAEKKLKELENIKENIRNMETAKEKKPVLRALKASKKKKDFPSVLNEVDLTPNDTRIPQDTIKRPDVHLRNTKRLRVTENNLKGDDKDGVNAYILIDDDPPKVSVSPESPLYGPVPKSTKSAISDDGLAYVNEIGQCKILPNIINEASLPVRGSQEGAEICFSAGVLAPDGTKRHLGSWCKRGQNTKGFNASSVSKQSSGDLIAVGADGRGGTTKVLKSLNRPLNDSRGSLFSAKNIKFGSKTSGFGSLQIDHFFSKANQ